MICKGELGPGDRIVERDLARRLGVSRIPIREGLARLESEGLIRCVPNAATYVEDFSPADTLEIYSMRLVLEPLATRLAAVRAGRRDLQQLRRLCAQMAACQETGNVERMDRADYEFHRRVVRISEHKRLIRAYENSHIQVLSLRKPTAEALAAASMPAADLHLQLVELLERHEPEAAERAAYEHVATSLRLMEQTLGVRLEDLPAQD